MWNKRGLSPVIATMLLIAIVLVLAIIIFLWARSFVGEKVQKDLGNGPEPIETACEKVRFSADVSSGIRSDENDPSRVTAPGLTVHVQNDGNVAIYKVQVKKKGFGSVKKIGGDGTFPLGRSLASGETQNSFVSISDSSQTVAVGDTLSIVPVILGEIEQNQEGYPCEKQSVEAKVIE